MGAEMIPESKVAPGATGRSFGPALRLAGTDLSGAAKLAPPSSVSKFTISLGQLPLCGVLMNGVSVMPFQGMVPNEEERKAIVEACVRGPQYVVNGAPLAERPAITKVMIADTKPSPELLALVKTLSSSGIAIDFRDHHGDEYSHQQYQCVAELRKIPNVSVTVVNRDQAPAIGYMIEVGELSRFGRTAYLGGPPDPDWIGGALRGAGLDPDSVKRPHEKSALVQLGKIDSPTSSHHRSLDFEDYRSSRDNQVVATLMADRGRVERNPSALQDRLALVASALLKGECLGAESSGIDQPRIDRIVHAIRHSGGTSFLNGRYDGESMRNPAVPPVLIVDVSKFPADARPADGKELDGIFKKLEGAKRLCSEGKSGFPPGYVLLVKGVEPDKVLVFPEGAFRQENGLDDGGLPIRNLAHRLSELDREVDTKRIPQSHTGRFGVVPVAYESALRKLLETEVRRIQLRLTDVD